MLAGQQQEARQAVVAVVEAVSGLVVVVRVEPCPLALMVVVGVVEGKEVEEEEGEEEEGEEAVVPPTVLAAELLLVLFEAEQLVEAVLGKLKERNLELKNRYKKATLLQSLPFIDAN